jgi:hypothetical protein
VASPTYPLALSVMLSRLPGAIEAPQLQPARSTQAAPRTSVLHRSVCSCPALRPFSHRLSSVCCLACPSACSAVVCRRVLEFNQAQPSMVVPVAPANSTHVMAGSVVGMNDAEEGVARRHSGSIKPMTTDSAAPHNGVIVSPTASPQLERGLGCGRPARARDPEPHPEPASSEACSTTELYSESPGASYQHHNVNEGTASQVRQRPPSTSGVRDRRVCARSARP